MVPRPLFYLAPAVLVSSLLVSCSPREVRISHDPAAVSDDPAAAPHDSAAASHDPARASHDPAPAPRPPLEAPPPPAEVREPSATAPPPAPRVHREFDISNPPAWYAEMEHSYDQAMLALGRGRKEEAISLFDGVLALESTHKPAALMKSRTLRELGRPGEGLHDLEAALDRRPRDLSLLEELAAVRLALGEPEKALDLIARALTEGGAVPGARYLRAVALAELKDREGALAALEDALQNGFVNLAVLEKEARFEMISEDPRFREVVASMEDFRRAVEASKR